MKMFYLVKILHEETDDQHYLTMPEIISELNDYGVDAIQSARFIMVQEMTELIRKLETLTGRHEAKHLHVFVVGRIRNLMPATDPGLFVLLVFCE